MATVGVKGLINIDDLMTS